MSAFWVRFWQWVQHVYHSPRVSRFLEIAAISTYILVLTYALIRMARVRMFWFDELFTLHLARLGSFSELWRNLAQGADNNPPLSYLLTMLCVWLFGETEWALRLPAILGSLLGALCLYAFVRYRRGPTEALLAAAAIGPTAPIWVYFIEARPYGLLVGLAGLLLLCWQRAVTPEGRVSRPWVIALGITAMAGMATHYYFVVPLVGLGLAEVTRNIATRRIHLAVWCALGSSAVMLAALYPLWGYGPQAYAAGFWAKVKFNRLAVEEAFHTMYAKEMILPYCTALAWGALAGAWPRRQNARTTESDTSYPLWDAVALVAFAAAPVIGVAIGAKLVGAYYFRYTLPVIIGLAGLMSLAVGRMSGPARWGCFLAALGFAYCGASGHWKVGPGHYKAEARDIRALYTFLGEQADGGVVLFESAFDFSRAWHYAPGKGFQPAFVADTTLALKHTQSDTIDRGTQALARFTDAPVWSFPEVVERVQAGEAIYLYGAGSWQRGELESLGVRFEQVAERSPGKLWKLLPNAMP